MLNHFELIVICFNTRSNVQINTVYSGVCLPSACLVQSMPPPHLFGLAWNSLVYVSPLLSRDVLITINLTLKNEDLSRCLYPILLIEPRRLDWEAALNIYNFVNVSMSPTWLVKRSVSSMESVRR